MKFLDAHTHIQLPAYDADRDAVILRAKEAGVAMVNVGTQAVTSRAAIELAEKHDDMWAAVGFHPSHCNETWHYDPDEQASPVQEIFDADTFRKLAAYPKVIAIGECGLDYYTSGERRVVSGEDRKKQKEVFLAQIKIAQEIGKPLMIHCRDAFSDLIFLLSAHHSPLSASSGIIHFFTGTIPEARQLLDLGFAFTFGGAITFPPRKNNPTGFHQNEPSRLMPEQALPSERGGVIGAYDEVIKFLPLEAILSETDAPYVAPASHRGQRNEPAYVVEVIQKLADLKNISLDEMSAAIRANAKRILKIG